MKIAVIGSGISGISVSWLLSQKYQIDCYEKNNYIGGHSNTVEIKYNDKEIAVDTGFIVFNHRTYPNLTNFFKHLDVATHPSKMSFASSINDGEFEFSGKSFSGLFSQIRNFFNYKFWLMLRDIVRFNKIAILEVENNQDITIGEFLEQKKFGKYFVNFYLLPMIASIWSCDMKIAEIYPLKKLVTFFHNHGLLTVSNQPQWHTVIGGSKEYIKKIIASFSGNIFINSEVIDISKCGDKLQLKVMQNGLEKSELYDKIIFANHGDEVFEILKNYNQNLSNLFSNFTFQKNIAVLHRDKSMMPINENSWSSWNFVGNYPYQDSIINSSFTYWMNNLQNIDNKFPLFVTLNPLKKIDQSKVFASFVYSHPVYNNASIKAQEQVEKMQGFDNIYYCGAYLGNGFHEDGLVSAIKVANQLGVSAPWQNS